MDKIKQFMKSFSDVLNQLGVNKGDCLYISSDIKVLLYKLASDYGIISKQERNRALNQMINCLQYAVGTKGTLLFPVFSWSFCRGKNFDSKRTKGEVGALSNWVITNRTDFMRTQHAIYSFMVWGADAELLVNMKNQDAWSECSPFYYLQSNNAKQLLFNIEAYQGMTFCHYIEQCVKVPYRHLKYFFGEYIDLNGKKEIRSYSMYVRDIDLKVDVIISNQFLIANKVAKQILWQENTLTVIELAKSYPFIRDDILYNNGKDTLYFHDYFFDWKQKQIEQYEIGSIAEELFKC